MRRSAEAIALLLTLSLAAWLRLGAAGVAEFKRDEANLARLALDSVWRARGHCWPEPARAF
jgi:hypothetical protein